MLFGFLLDHFIISLQQILGELKVNVVSSGMEEGAVLSVEDGLEFGDEVLDELLGSLVV